MDPQQVPTTLMEPSMQAGQPALPVLTKGCAFHYGKPMRGCPSCEAASGLWDKDKENKMFVHHRHFSVHLTEVMDKFGVAGTPVKVWVDPALDRVHFVVDDLTAPTYPVGAQIEEESVPC